jgi:hypothetical protein
MQVKLPVISNQILPRVRSNQALLEKRIRGKQADQMRAPLKSTG